MILQQHTIDLGDGVSVSILDLAMVITLKELAGREKDLAVLPVLRRTLDERQKRDSQGTSRDAPPAS